MKLLMKSWEKIKLILEDGSIFSGYSFGKYISSAGEVVFNTGMTGYPESLTDPSYRGQILVLTYPLIGNYGVPNKEKDENNILKNFESDSIHIKGLIVSNYSHEHSHWNAEKSLSDWLKEHNVPGIFGIDTRALTKKLREKGVCLGKIVPENENPKNITFDNPDERDLVAEVSTKEKIKYGKGKTKIVLLDMGAKENIISELVKRNTTVIRVPYDYNFLEEDFDGLMISNGPGDPKMCKTTIENVRKAMTKKIPTFGICLGNQIVALASGADTYKLKYGHRSQNQPCIDKDTGRCYITSQNHGFAVDTKTLKEGWDEWFINANDNTNEGIKHKSGLFRTVQFHPESNPGPVDTKYLFDEFIDLVKSKK